MNAYEKNNAYGASATAYDYSEERDERVSEGFSDAYKGSFESAFYYGAAERELEHEFESAPSIEKEPELNDDLMPSELTRNFGKDRTMLNDYREESETGVVKKFKINAKAKVFIAVYAVVIATIFALIILNTTLLKRLDNAVAAKQSQISVMQAENLELNKTLGYVSDDAVIEQKAAEMGMIKR